MHYGDKKHLKENELQVVVYKHEICGKEDSYDYDITSIQSCNYFPPRLLKELFSDPAKYLENDFKDKKSEEWYLVTIKSTDGYNDMKIKSIKLVSKSRNEFHRLH